MGYDAPRYRRRDHAFGRNGGCGHGEFDFYGLTLAEKVYIFFIGPLDEENAQDITTD